MSVASLNGVDLYYEMHGKGRPLFFAHGASGSHMSWWQQVPFFAEKYTCIPYDQRGFGRSVPTADYDMRDGNVLCADLRNLVDHLGLGDTEVIVLGVSLGSLAALSYAHERPDATAAVILSGGFGSLKSTAFDEGWSRRTAMFAGVMQTIRGSTSDGRGGFAQSPDERGRFLGLYSDTGPMGPAMIERDAALAFLYVEMAAAASGPPLSELGATFGTSRQLTRDDAATLDVPIMFVGGDLDHVFPPDELRYACELFPRGTHVNLAGLGHSSYFEDPAAFNAAVSGFLADNDL